jgi:adenylate cyclase
MGILSNLLRGFVILLILLASAGAIFLSFIIREVDSPTVKQALGFTASFEGSFYDYRMNKLIDKEKLVPQVVLAKVDDASIKDIGRFPWSRDVWAQIVTNLKNYGAKVLAFDVMFSEVEKSCSEISGDTLFAAAIEDFQSIPGNKVILGYGSEPYQIEEMTFAEMPEELYNFIVESKQSGDSGLAQYWVSSTTYPIKELLNAGAHLGFISNREDNDGVFRYYPLVNNFDSIYLPSLALISYLSLIEDEERVLQISEYGNADYIINDKHKLTLNSVGETKIRWIGGIENFPDVPLMDIYRKADDPEIRKIVEGKLVFIGSTAIGAHDFRNTSIDAKLPGVYAHMNVVHMLMDKFFYKPANLSTSYSLWLLALGAFILLIVQFFKNPFFDLFALISIMVGSYYVDIKFLLPEGFEIRLFFCYFAYLGVYSWNTFLNFSASNQEKKMIKGTFARFVAPTVVDEMLNDPSQVKVGGQRKDITCMFSDVRDFTSISEALGAEELARALNIYMGQMTDIVFETEGTVDKYIGDAIVALWGAPLDIGNHAEKAVNAAIKMIELMPKINDDFKAQNLPEFKIGIGLNSGECSVGNMGSDKIFSYTALGDNMNLGARLEGLCKPYGALILISGYTFARLDPEKFKCRKLDLVRVKGKTQPVEIYEVLTSLHPLMNDQEMYLVFVQSVDDFHSRKFDAAVMGFEAVLSKYPEDVPSKRFLKMAQDYIKEPPADDWDGVYTFTTK